MIVKILIFIAVMTVYTIWQFWDDRRHQRQCDARVKAEFGR